MQEKKKKKRSIITRISFLLMLIICTQALISFYTILFTDIATTVESYSYSSFTRTVANRKSNLESFMSTSWSNISEISSSVSEIYQEVSEGRSSLTDDETTEFLSESANELVKMILMTGTTGGFIILDDGEEMQYNYSATYLKSYDNISQVINSDNLMLAIGPSSLSQEFGFSMVSNWNYGLMLSEETYPILSVPIEAIQHTKSLEYLGYWHISTDITNENLKVLTCSMPILDKDQNPIGVIGVEVSQEYFYKFLPETEFGDTGSYGYILADIELKGDTVQAIPNLINGNVQNELISVDDAIELTSLNLQEHNLEEEPMLMQTEENSVCVYFEPLQLYANNSPFEEHNIWIVGMLDLDNITSFTIEFWDVIQSMLIISVCGGLVCSYLIGRKVANPIINLSKTVADYDIQEKIMFKTTNIREIDELSSVIEEMQENIFRSAGRTEKILEILNKRVGSFEFDKTNGIITVSNAIYPMLDLQKNTRLTSNEFFKKLNDLKSNAIEEIPNTYATHTLPIVYYKVEEFHQGDILFGVIEDTTKEVEDLLVLNYERNYDMLTGILNRRAFHQKVSEIWKPNEMGVAGFVLFDLDNLKYVNDTFGHDSGDVYIKTAATMIHSALHKYGVVGRMSGDEFYAFLYGFSDKEGLLDVLTTLYKNFENEPIEMPNATEFKIRVSGGVSWYGEDSSDFEELKRYADFAMYKGKQNLKGELRQFDKEQYLEESFMLSGKEELNRILDNELVDFAFQPIISIKTGKIYAYEALMRPDSEILASPIKLLQLATLEGKLWRVEKIVFFKTLSLFKKYTDMFNGAKIFINSIPSEKLKETEYDELYNLYEEYLPNVVVEITEQEQQDDSLIQQKIEKLHIMKTNIALDDYGSGYANDIGLIKMKPNVVKIDRSIISNVHVDPSRQAIVNKIITFCKDQNIIILGEGIETEQELEYLIQAGIDLAQGYYISRPMQLPQFNTNDIELKISEIKNEIEQSI